MTTPTPHPFAHVLEPLALDASTQFEMEECGKWRSVSIRYMLEQIAVPGCTDEFRVKPATIMIGQREVPKPVGVVRPAKWLSGDNWINLGDSCVRFHSEEDVKAFHEAVVALLEGRP